MAPEPQRREHRKTHLDASVVPVEQALLARAADLESSSMTFRQAVEQSTFGDDQAAAEFAVTTAAAHGVMANEFRRLAEELHYW
jgi:hypothetical protein